MRNLLFLRASSFFRHSSFELRHFSPKGEFIRVNPGKSGQKNYGNELSNPKLEMVETFLKASWQKYESRYGTPQQRSQNKKKTTPSITSKRTDQFTHAKTSRSLAARIHWFGLRRQISSRRLEARASPRQCANITIRSATRATLSGHMHPGGAMDAGENLDLPTHGQRAPHRRG